VIAPDRVVDIRLSNALTGIDFVQVSPTQLELFVFVQHLALPAPLAAALATITPQQVTIHAQGAVAPAKVRVLQHVLPIPAINGRPALHFVVEVPGGFGWYRLRIDHPAIDTYFNDVLFSFKADCPSGLDCKAKPHDCPDEARVDFPVDYGARDFWSFRQALIDFASQRYPDWQDRLEADVAMMLLEAMSALGDEFSYASDRVTREHVLDEASQRRSLRHLAALVDYRLDNGSGAFTWIDVQCNALGMLNAGEAVTDARNVVAFELGRGLADTGKVFAVSSTRNFYAPYLWDENTLCLLVGERHLTLVGQHAPDFLPDIGIDPVGKWVLLETVPTDPAKPERRIAVRVTSATDAVDPLNGSLVTEIEWDAGIPFELDLETLRLRGNLVPATSGRTATVTFRIGPALPGGPAMEQALERVGPNHDLTDEADVVADPDEVDEPLLTRRIQRLFSLPGSDATPLVWLPAPGGGMRPEVRVVLQGGTDWIWMPALIGDRVASVTDEVFTLEDGTYRQVFSVERPGGRFTFSDYATSAGSTVRFGDGELGLAPADGDVFDVSFRLYNGRLANVAADTLVAFASEFLKPPVKPAFVDRITNPLAAEGGRDSESAESIRISAPEMFRLRPLRAVRPEDYADIAERLPWIQKAGAALRWTGSWATMFVTPDPHEEVGLTRAHRTELEDLTNRVRQAGRDVRVNDPRYADIDLEIVICVAANAYPGEVKQRVLVALFGDSHHVGFFDPDHFTFGTPLSRAALMAAIQDVPGVKAVEKMRVRRRGYFKWRPLNEFALRVGPGELLRVTNDRLLPERGAVTLFMDGGA